MEDFYELDHLYPTINKFLNISQVKNSEFKTKSAKER